MSRLVLNLLFFLSGNEEQNTTCSDRTQYKQYYPYVGVLDKTESGNGYHHPHESNGDGF